MKIKITEQTFLLPADLTDPIMRFVQKNQLLALYYDVMNYPSKTPTMSFRSFIADIYVNDLIWKGCTHILQYDPSCEYWESLAD